MYHSKVMSGLANLIEPILKLNLTKETDYQIMEWIRETALLPMRYTRVTFFYNVNATVRFGNCLY